MQQQFLKKKKTSLFVHLEQMIKIRFYSVGSTARLLANAKPRSVDC